MKTRFSNTCCITFVIAFLMAFCLSIWPIFTSYSYAAQTDFDMDGIPDDLDNCPTIFNSDQKNTDKSLSNISNTYPPGDAQGDACDLDSDNDGFGDIKEIEAGSNPLDPHSLPVAFVPDELEVVFKQDANQSEIESLISQLQTEIINRDGSTYLLRIPSGSTATEIVYRFQWEAIVAYSMPNFMVTLENHLPEPDDPGFATQWHLKNRGQVVAFPGPDGRPQTADDVNQPGMINADIDARQGWQLKNDCSSFAVAVLDTGSTHPDFGGNFPNGNLWVNKNEIAGDRLDNDANGFIDDVNGANMNLKDGDIADNLPVVGGGGHGTSVAGVIAAKGNNKTDLAGVCWKVQLITVVKNLRGSSVVDGVKYVRNLVTRATNPVNVRVINFSGTISSFSPSLRTEIKKAGAQNILFVTAAGQTPNKSYVGDMDSPGGIERIYLLPNPGVRPVAPNDLRVTGGQFGQQFTGTNLFPGSVKATDPDIGDPLVAFTPAEKHTGTQPFKFGQDIYLDNQAPGKPGHGIVSEGDQRLTLVSVGGEQYIPASGVLPGDADALAGAPLVGFLDTEMHSGAGHLNPQQPVYPCAYDLPNIICVTASNARDEKASWANWGARSVDLAAPGESVRVLNRPGDPGGTTTIKSGTSFATPQVSGAAAHCLSLFPKLTVLELKDKILTEVDPRPGLAGSVLSGKNHDGRLSMCKHDDFGDAPDPKYESKATLVPNGSRLQDRNGARHEEFEEEWLEMNHNWSAVLDPGVNGEANSVQSDADFYDDGVKLYPPYIAGEIGRIDFQVNTANGHVPDASGPQGRYDVNDPAKRLYINIYFDWNNNDIVWDDAEQILNIDNPDCARATWYGAPGFNDCTGMPWAAPLKYKTVSVYFRVPEYIKSGIAFARIRLDYGENVGLAPQPLYESVEDQIRFVGGSPDTLPHDPGPLSRHLGLAQFGEVEDHKFLMSQLPNICDIDGDYDIDVNDIMAIMSVRNSAATKDDPRDADGNGLINVNDSRICATACTRPSCAP